MGNKRKAIGDNLNAILFDEVDGICPLCTNPLMYEKRNKLLKKFEVAHIYPLNPSDSEKKLLLNEERLSDDPDNIDNLIALCRDCHTKFDKPKTIEEYRQLLALKKNLILKREEKNKWFNFNIEKEVNFILETLCNENPVSYSNELKYNPKKVDEKTDDSLDILTKRRIVNDISDYYVPLKRKFKELDKLSLGTSDIIARQINLYYLKLKQNKLSQTDIYNYLVEWLNKKTLHYSLEACKIVISFFVQNSEVFE